MIRNRNRCPWSSHTAGHHFRMSLHGWWRGPGSLLWRPPPEAFLLLSDERVVYPQMPVVGSSGMTTRTASTLFALALSAKSVPSWAVFSDGS
jgi:hypothetical protein